MQGLEILSKKILRVYWVKILSRELLGVYFSLNSYLWNKGYLPNLDILWAKQRINVGKYYENQVYILNLETFGGKTSYKYKGRIMISYLTVYLG